MALHLRILKTTFENSVIKQSRQDFKEVLELATSRTILFQNIS